MAYRTYDRAWNRTGYSATPQYSGQADITDDYPAKCHCGSSMKGCGDATWLYGAGREAPARVKGRSGYVAWCGNGHELHRQPVSVDS